MGTRRRKRRRGRRMKFFALLALAQANDDDVAEFDTKCTNIGGTCLNWDHYKCTAGWESGLCSGASNIKCCKPCNKSCQNTEAGYKDRACKNAGGECKHNTNKCSLGYSGGMCDGPSERQCCGASGGGGGSGSCNLQTYSNTHMKGYNGLKVEVDKGFKGEMDKMNGWAKQCSVTIQITHAFRKEGQNIGGTVVPPASNSNHLVGHAIDFNIDTPRGWCDGWCMEARTNSYAKCFADKVIADKTLDWGILFNDPVHVDDYLNGRNPSS